MRRSIFSLSTPAIANRRGARPSSPCSARQPNAKVGLAAQIGQRQHQHAAPPAPGGRCPARPPATIPASAGPANTCSSASARRLRPCGSNSDDSGMPRTSMPIRSCNCIPASRNRAMPGRDPFQQKGVLQRARQCRAGQSRRAAAGGTLRASPPNRRAPRPAWQSGRPHGRSNVAASAFAKERHVMIPTPWPIPAVQVLVVASGRLW